MSIRSQVCYTCLSLTIAIIFYEHPLIVSGKRLGLSWLSSEQERSDVSNSFLLKNGDKVFDAQTGSIKVWSPARNAVLRKDNVFVTVATLEPSTVTIPAYFSENLALYVVSGVGQLGLVKKSGSVEIDIHAGDVYAITAGHVHYFVNAESPCLQLLIVLQGNKRSPFNYVNYQPFYVNGGTYPRGVLGAFDDEILSQAFKVDKEDVERVLFNQNNGPIVQIQDSSRNSISRQPNRSSSILQRIFQAFGGTDVPLPYNLVEEDPHDVQKEGGWSTAAHKDKSAPLGKADLGAFVVSLKQGALLVPHFNPKGTEVALVTRGRGWVQISHPNGTLALDKRVQRGDIFVVPQFHAVVQKASPSEGLEFVGISTSSSTTPAVFLAGKGSLLSSLSNPLLSSVLNVREALSTSFLGSQDESIIVRATQQSEERAFAQ